MAFLRARATSNRAAALAALLALLSALILSGCAWTGKGKEVADALQRTEQFKSRAFTGAVNVKVSSEPNNPMHMTFTGAIDNSDAANPKMTMQMSFDADGQSQTMSVTLPGDGNLYMVSPAGTYGFPVPPGQAASSTIDSQKIYAALYKSVSDIPLVKAIASKSPDERLALIVDRLARMKSTRPATVKTLAKTIERLFLEQLTSEEIDALIKRLQAKGVVTVTGSRVAYSLPA